jgi:hypothetical protein
MDIKDYLVMELRRIGIYLVLLVISIVLLVSPYSQLQNIGSDGVVGVGVYIVVSVFLRHDPFELLAMRLAEISKELGNIKIGDLQPRDRMPPLSETINNAVEEVTIVAWAASAVDQSRVVIQERLKSAKRLRIRVFIPSPDADDIIKIMDKLDMGTTTLKYITSTRDSLADFYWNSLQEDERKRFELWFLTEAFPPVLMTIVDPQRDTGLIRVEFVSSRNNKSRHPYFDLHKNNMAHRHWFNYFLNQFEEEIVGSDEDGKYKRAKKHNFEDLHPHSALRQGKTE